MTAVLDASAVLALLYREPGHDQVAEMLAGAVVSTVNWSEIVQKLGQRGHPAPGAAAEGLQSLGVHVRPFTVDDATRAALLWPATRRVGLSLGDRACLAVASGVPEGVAVTADKAWTTLGLDIPVLLVR
ncbi:MAG: PIN domain-containing protein [Actinophytocola sp.]|nr:PIN domain-containing protein [Actinophytocola sp.]